MKLALVSLLASTLVSSQISPPTTGDKPPPGSVTIGPIIYGGTGCPQGTVSENMNSDGTAITLLFDSYIASIGPNVPVTENRKNCQINVQLNVPQGWQYSIATIDYRGFLQLDPGVVAQQSALYYFQGSVDQDRCTTTFTNANNGDYTIRDKFGLATTVWSGCNAKANININSQIRLTAPAGKSGFITTDSIDSKVTHVYGVQWEKC
ncbi:hypothetical protein HK099_004940 [Clydaea vesicula]|uniref:Secreted protein n=1 Tax=Clydaea vesicula TaxID=447962 RepID=A0AAD5U005_9FUNG|nr:hypothetical protein HK099_004940 [Clydaea vesicula]KAJ3393765.1 hypothetical protein HDU92_007510 [Lobulomyces angularis]